MLRPSKQVSHNVYFILIFSFFYTKSHTTQMWVCIYNVANLGPLTLEVKPSLHLLFILYHFNFNFFLILFFFGGG